MQVVLLLAGKGSRMGDLTENTHKSLIEINENESFLSRLMHQLNEYSISKIVAVTGYLNEQVEEALSHYQLNTRVVRNDKYDQDTNIRSIKLAFDELNKTESVIILEGDIWLDDLALKQIYEESEKNDSVWFTKGDFQSNQRGGIIEINSDNNPTEILVVKEYDEKFKGYKKMTGVMTIAPSQLALFHKLINSEVESGRDQYFFNPWVQHLDELPSRVVDLNPKQLFSANTIEELQILKDAYQYLDADEIELVETDKLHPIEDFIKERYTQVLDKIKREQHWTKPIIIDGDNNLVLDGHHRFEVAKKLGLKRIPAIKVKYDEIQIWSLRKDETVSHSLVTNRALQGNIYPNKTVKHAFPFQTPKCNYTLENLMN